MFRVGATPPPDYVQFSPPDEERALAYLVGDRVLVAVNGGDVPVEIGVEVPAGEWVVVARADAEAGRVAPDGLGPWAGRVEGRPSILRVAPKGVEVLVRRSP